MASFVVMTAPGRTGPNGPEAAFVRDGFAFLAFLFPWPWLLWHRLWIEALIAIAIALGLSVIGSMTGHALAGSLLSLLVSIYVGLEGAALRIAALRRRGWTEWGVVDAETEADAETKFFVEADEAELSQPRTQASATPRPVANPLPIHGRPYGPGLLLNPGDR